MHNVGIHMRSRGREICNQTECGVGIYLEDPDPLKLSPHLGNVMIPQVLLSLSFSTEDTDCIATLYR